MTQKWVILGKGFLSSSLERFASEYHIPCEILGREKVDLCDADQIKHHLRSIEGQKTVLMPAAIVRLRENSRSSYQQNIEMVQNALDSLDDSVVRFVYFSSIDVYGKSPNLPISEDNSIEPQDYYSLSKVAGEFFVKEFCNRNNISWNVLRLSGMFGSKETCKSVVGRMFNTAIRDKTITINCDPTTARDFVFVEDVSRFVSKVCKSGKSKVFNVATGVSYTIEELAYVIKDVVNKSIEISLDVKKSQRSNGLIFSIDKINKEFPDFKFGDLKSNIHQYYKEEFI